MGGAKTIRPAWAREWPIAYRPLAGALSERRICVLAAVGIAVAAGLLSDLVAARGPVTATEALTVMAIALGLGLIGGRLTRTRWILLPLAIAYAAGVELGRLGLVGASLEVRFDNAFGIIAFVLARGLHGLLALVPLSLGVALGASPGGRVSWRGRAARGILAGTAIALAAGIAWPASTPPVLTPDGRPIPGSIAELATVEVGGTQQSVLIRAADPDKPVLLYLAGGPGQSDLALARVATEPWTRDFVVAMLDQRGNGKSYAAIDPVGSMTLDQAVADVIAVTDYLRGRFDERKVYLMGESWGTILGVLAVQRRPDLFLAWIGSGQMVDVVETDRRIYDDLVAYAARLGDTALAAKLTGIGRPPYRDIPWANSNLLGWYDYLYKPYEPSAGYTARGEASGLDPFGILGSEYSLIEKANVLRGLIDTFALMYPQLYGLDFRQSAESLHVPVYILDGTAELTGRRDLMLEWYAALEAPSKERVEYAGAAHATAFEQADAVGRLLSTVVVPATYER